MGKTNTPETLPSIEPTPVKPGYQTTELYLTLLFVIPAIAKLLSTNLDPDKVESLATTLVFLIPAATSVWQYLKSRAEVKKTAINASVAKSKQ